MPFEVETRSLDDQATAVGAAGPYTVIIDRPVPVSAGGGGLGLNGGELLYLAVAGCVSNDLFREAQAADIALRRVQVRARGGFTGDPAVSTAITYEVDVEGDAPAERLRALVEDVDRIAEIPNSFRSCTSSPTRCLAATGL